MTNDANKTSGEIERDVERTRARMTDTLDELRARMSPGQIVDQVFDYARDSGGGEMLQNLGRTVRDNPAPLLLMGAGVLWMMATSGPSNRGKTRGSVDDLRSGTRSIPSQDKSSLSNRATGAISGAASLASKASDAASDFARSATSRISEGASSLSEKVSDAASGINKTFSSMGDTLGAAAGNTSGALHDARAAAGRGGDFAYRSAAETGNAISDLLREQPLIVGALGLALGAAIGTALPITEAEDTLMGDTRDALRDKVEDLAADQYEGAKAVAETTLNEVKEEADKQGLTAGNTKEGLSSLGAKAQAVMETAKDTIGREAERHGFGDPNSTEVDPDKEITGAEQESGMSSGSGTALKAGRSPRPPSSG